MGGRAEEHNRMGLSSGNHEAYRRVEVETASQGKLVVMLFNGAIQRAEEAKRQLEKGVSSGAHNNLIRAQEIITELRGALNMKAGIVATNLDRIYEYFQHLLIQANLRKEGDLIDECVTHLISIRDTWEEAFRDAATTAAPEGGVPRPPQAGSGVMDLQG
jgi:flagellar secretion chaperone FliS